MYGWWTNAAATQAGASVPVSVVTHEDEKYALVDVVPDRGAVTVVPTGIPEPAVVVTGVCAAAAVFLRR